ncbi:hypothetical protein [Rhodoferax sp.]|uniref:hypothetical protein n=1 Tax=Rhodoferax sp. TaxID=50421 RepID=UPI00386A20B1
MHTHEIFRKDARQPRIFQPAASFTAAARICAAQVLKGHSDVSTTIMDTHVLKVTTDGMASPLDKLTSSVARRFIYKKQSLALILFSLKAITYIAIKELKAAHG